MPQPAPAPTIAPKTSIPRLRAMAEWHEQNAAFCERKGWPKRQARHEATRQELLRQIAALSGQEQD